MDPQVHAVDLHALVGPPVPPRSTQNSLPKSLLHRERGLQQRRVAFDERGEGLDVHFLRVVALVQFINVPE